MSELFAECMVGGLGALMAVSFLGIGEAFGGRAPGWQGEAATHCWIGIVAFGALLVLMGYLYSINFHGWKQW